VLSSALTMLEAVLSLDRLTTIAHRGGAKLRPENTLAAFDHALELGVDAIECDVHLSRDGEVVVIHDPTLDRTTDASGRVRDMTAVQLAQVDAGFRFSSNGGFPYRGAGCTIPTLHDVLDRYRQVPVVIEVKGEDPLVAERTIAVIQEHDAAGRVVIGGFSHAVLTSVRLARPDLATSASKLEARRALTRSYVRLSPRQPAFRVFQMPFRLRGRQMFRRTFVAAARRGGVPVQAWVVDQPDDMRRLIGWGVTGIITDRPDVGMEVTRDPALTLLLSESRPRRAGPWRRNLRPSGGGRPR
jgi:glycerophosphoryl diester phosphodiesterase